jgi:glycosyltransferase involved in cell wall biosynthesis
MSLHRLDPLTLPLVSVCIPVYNAEKYISEAIESILCQTYPNIEIIVTDDGSDDDTLAILEREFGNEGIVICTQQKKGAAAARNVAFRRSKGDFVKFLDADDLLSAKAIESQVRAALDHPGSVISGKWGRFYHDDINTFKLSPEECWQTMEAKRWLCSSWASGRTMTQPGIFLIPRAVADKAGPWDEKLSLIDDMDFFTRIMLHSNQVIFEPESILFYRSGVAGSLSRQKSEEAYLSAFNAIRQSTHNLLAADNSADAKVASANLWQSFVHEVYPGHPELYMQAEQKIKELGGASLAYICGPVTQAFVNVLGWKLTKRLKSNISKFSSAFRQQ